MFSAISDLALNATKREAERKVVSEVEKKVIKSTPTPNRATPTPNRATPTHPASPTPTRRSTPTPTRSTPTPNRSTPTPTPTKQNSTRSVYKTLEGYSSRKI